METVAGHAFFGRGPSGVDSVFIVGLTGDLAVDHLSRIADDQADIIEQGIERSVIENMEYLQYLRKDYALKSAIGNAVEYGATQNLAALLSNSRQIYDFDLIEVYTPGGVLLERSRSDEINVPLGRAGTTEEAAGAVYLLCSPESNYISGQTLICSGGLTV